MAVSSQCNYHKPNDCSDLFYWSFVSVYRMAWQCLGNMSREDAMAEFISFLRKSCTLFAPYVEAHVAERQERERKW